MNVKHQRDPLQRAKPVLAVAAGLFVLCTGQAFAQSAPKPAALPKAVASGVAQQPKPIQVYEDIWVLNSDYKPITGQWVPQRPKVLTREEVASLKSFPCVADIAARRLDGSVDVRGPNNKPVRAEIWTFDSAFGIGARGWTVPAGASTPDVLYLGSKIAKETGSGASADSAAKLELVSYFDDITTYKDGKQVGGPVRSEILVTGSDGQTRVKSITMKHGGMLTQQPVLKGTGPVDLVIRMAPIFQPTEPKWTHIEHNIQGLGSVIYVRAKPNLNASARAACQKQIEERTRAWTAQLPELTWTIEPLKIYF